MLLHTIYVKISFFREVPPAGSFSLLLPHIFTHAPKHSSYSVLIDIYVDVFVLIEVDHAYVPAPGEEDMTHYKYVRIHQHTFPTHMTQWTVCALRRVVVTQVLANRQPKVGQKSFGLNSQNYCVIDNRHSLQKVQ